MVGAAPKLRADIRADRTLSGARSGARRIALVSALVPLSLTLVQCGRAPNPAALAANSQANVQIVAKTNPQVASSDTFEDRFPAPQFKERFPSASESLLLLDGAFGREVRHLPLQKTLAQTRRPAAASAGAGAVQGRLTRTANPLPASGT